MKRLIVILVSWFILLNLHSQSPLFKLLDPQQTGVDFSNQIVDTKEHNILIYSNYYGGAGIGIGDFNQDGLPDLYFAGNLVGDRLYINQGNLKFKDVTETAGILNRGGWSSGVAVADVNRDGWLDIYVAKELYDEQTDLRKNELYINQRDGTFKEEAAQYGLDSDARTRHALFFDYDKDGWLDLYLLNHPPNAGNYSDLLGIDEDQEIFSSRLYRNTGKGKFEDVSKASGLLKTGYPNSACAVDLNNDGWQDLYVGNDFAKPDWCFLNNKDGTFTNVIDTVAKHISYFSMGVDAADINNDGWQDLMVVDMQAEDNYRIKSNMSGMDPDAFWKVYEDGGHYQYMFNTLHLNQGGAPQQGKSGFALSDVAQLGGISSTDWSWSNLLADFDNDGWKDIFVTNGLYRDIRNTDSDRAFPQYVQKVVDEFIQQNPEAGKVSIWDILDLDEALKIIPSEPLNNYAYKNNGDLTFTKVIKDWGFEAKTFSNGSAYADLDLDGDLDLVINNLNEVAYIYENTLNQNNEQAYLRVKLNDKNNHLPIFGSKVKITINGESQYYEFTNIRGMYSTSEPIAHFGLAKATKVDQLTVSWSDGSQTILTDIPVNQLLEIDYSTAQQVAASKVNTPTLFTCITEELNLHFEHQENDFDDYEKQVLLPHKMSQFGPAMAVGDINKDGLEDVFIGGAAGQAGKLFLQRENGFQGIQLNTFAVDKNYEDVDATFLDYDQDGDLDLYVVSGGNAFEAGSEQYQDRLYANNGSGVLSPTEDILPPFFESGSCVRPHDIDGDGDLDLFVGGRHRPWDYPAPTSSRILENVNGVYQDVTFAWAKELMGLGMVTDAVWTDYDQDGLSDLFIVGEWMPLTILKQDKSKQFKIAKAHKLGLENTEGWWYSIQSKDMDGDGDEDLLAGNLGLNYKYKATPEEPFEVFYNDFDGNDSRDIVLSYYNYGKKYPLRGRSCSSEQIPVLKKKFTSYNLFAEADLESVYTPKALDQSLNYKASTFASSYLENLGNGRFKVTPLPNSAQVSSLNSFILDDFNQDGHQDILAAGNLFVSEIETTRNDAGVGNLLLGDGKGTFTSLPARQSGVFLPYDVKRMKVLNTKKRGKTILVGVNDGEVVLLTMD